MHCTKKFNKYLKFDNHYTNTLLGRDLAYWIYILQENSMLYCYFLICESKVLPQNAMP